MSIFIDIHSPLSSCVLASGTTVLSLQSPVPVSPTTTIFRATPLSVPLLTFFVPPFLVQYLSSPVVAIAVLRAGEPNRPCPTFEHRPPLSTLDHHPCLHSTITMSTLDHHPVYTRPSPLSTLDHHPCLHHSCLHSTVAHACT